MDILWKKQMTFPNFSQTAAKEWKGEEVHPNKELVKLKKAEVEEGYEFDSPGVSRPLSSSYSSTTTCSFHP